MLVDMLVHHFFYWFLVDICTDAVSCPARCRQLKTRQ